MQQKHDADIVVVGGGTAGAVCAIAAARLGLHTILVEKTGMIGGVAATTLMGSFANLAVTTEHEPLLGGLVTEIIARLVACGATPYHSLQDALHSTIDAPFTIPFLPIYYTKILTDMLRESSATVFLDSVFIGGQEIAHKKQLLFACGSTRFTVDATVAVDATGNADVAAAIGAPVNEGVSSHGCLMRIGGVDIEKTFAYIKEAKPWEPDATFAPWLREKLGIGKDEKIPFCRHLLDPLSYDHAPMETREDTLLTPKRFEYIEKRWKGEGIFYNIELNLLRKKIRTATDHGDFILNQIIAPGQGITFNGDGIAYGAWGEGVALCNVAKPYGFHAENPQESTRASLEALQYNFMMFAFFKKYVPGFENSALLDMGSQTISRVGRTICGCEDLPATPEHAVFTTPIYLFGGVYAFWQGDAVPYGRIVCREYDNLFAVGKCSSKGFSFRSQLSCMSMGVAAAAAAKVIQDTQCTAHSMPADALRRQLKTMCVILEKEHANA
ncbi:MAG: FAD-dependent oxidoreductase [Ruthenibacterium sp.]